MSDVDNKLMVVTS